VKYVFPFWSTPAVAVAGSDTFYPVRRIYCVGRNYAEHAREMGFDPNREPPFFLGKPADIIVTNGSTVAYPLATQNLAAREAALLHVFGDVASST
jgi:fumarylpyruvate hydrolase